MPDTSLTWAEADRKLPGLFTSLYLVVVTTLTAWLPPNGLRSSQGPYHEWLGTSFRSGRYWITEVAQASKCPWDMSFYKGKCFLNWGLPPSLFHTVLPIVSDHFATVIATAIAVFFLMKCVLRVAQSIADRDSIDLFVLLPFLCFLTFSSSLATTGVIGRVYEESIAFASAFAFSAIYYLLPILLKDSWDALGPKELFRGGTLLAFAALSRATWYIPAGLVGLSALAAVAKGKWKLRHALPLLVPLVAMGAFQGWYNWLRFDSPFDFGLHKSNGFAVLHEGTAWHPEFFFRNVMAYFVVGFPPVINPLHASAGDSTHGYLAINQYFHAGLVEGCVGLLVAMPTLLFALPLFRRLSSAQRRKLGTIAGLGLPMLIVILIQPGQMFRYTPEVILVTVLTLVPVLLAHSPGGLTRRNSLHWVGLSFGLAVHFINLLWVIRFTTWV